eukprot:TRINITY_DN5385_c0_g3_i1.p1 TRINITY_DN5385_c0_g3~~TRINITY_DN5385_c0_g3_i1.p1  ORF type:complete len:290 (+),score=68.60 TRINITY_DN5385_c0_g3_i1:130-999(+)
MMDARALLDSLMGPARDKSGKDRKSKDGWKEPNVCKRFLVGFCPNSATDNWFHNTRRDTGLCNKVHSDLLKAQFEEHTDRDKYQVQYEQEFLNYLEATIAECDAWIARERSNCAPPGKVMRLPEGQKMRLGRLHKEAEEMLKKAEDLAEKGDLAGSKAASEKSMKAKEEMKQVKEEHTFTSEGETVCEVCGVRGSKDDSSYSEVLMNAHLNGNLHSAMLKIRAKAKELREKLRNAPRSDHRDRDRDRDRGDRGRRRERSRSRDPREEQRERSRSRRQERRNRSRSRRRR